jgi:hypothetical protein
MKILGRVKRNFPRVTTGMDNLFKVDLYRIEDEEANRINGQMFRSHGGHSSIITVGIFLQG